jgi:hypothetical protein
MIKIIKNLLLLLVLLNSITAKSQTKQVTNQSLYWMRYYNQLSLNEKWTWHNEIDTRRFLVNSKHHHLIMHSRIHYKFYKNVDAALGFTYSLQDPQDPYSESNLTIPELRIVQEINQNNPITNKFSIQHRVRIDERFFRKNDGKELLEGYDFNFRFRYRFQATYKLLEQENKNATTLKVADEIMINAGKNIVYNHFDQNRIYAGVEQGLSKNFSVELGYMYWYQQRASGYQFFDRDIIRLTFYHKIKI